MVSCKFYVFSELVTRGKYLTCLGYANCCPLIRLYLNYISLIILFFLGQSFNCFHIQRNVVVISLYSLVGYLYKMTVFGNAKTNYFAIFKQSYSAFFTKIYLFETKMIFNRLNIPSRRIFVVCYKINSTLSFYFWFKLLQNLFLNSNIAWLNG